MQVGLLDWNIAAISLLQKIVQSLLPQYRVSPFTQKRDSYDPIKV